jgi:hypothetical protein
MGCGGSGDALGSRWLRSGGFGGPSVKVARAGEVNDLAQSSSAVGADGEVGFNTPG